MTIKNNKQSKYYTTLGRTPGCTFFNVLYKSVCSLVYECIYIFTKVEFQEYFFCKWLFNIN